jgi:GNAT superfamily N-acetyltransferase
LALPDSERGQKARLVQHGGKLDYHHAHLGEDFEFVRGLRNAYRDLMEVTDYITPEMQAEWVTKLLASDDELFIYTNYETQERVGYGLLTFRAGVWYVSLAVDSAFQGHGIGSFIYRHLGQQRWSVYAAIKNYNVPSLRSCLHAGYKITDVVLSDQHGVLLLFKGSKNGD